MASRVTRMHWYNKFSNFFALFCAFELIDYFVKPMFFVFYYISSMFIISAFFNLRFFLLLHFFVSYSACIQKSLVLYLHRGEQKFLVRGRQQHLSKLEQLKCGVLVTLLHSCLNCIKSALLIWMSLVVVNLLSGCWIHIHKDIINSLLLIN